MESRNGGTIDMGQDQIAKRWRKLLIHELQDRYGLAKEQAQEKADVWLRLVQREPQSLVTAAVQDTGPVRDGFPRPLQQVQIGGRNGCGPSLTGQNGTGSGNRTGSNFDDRPSFDDLWLLVADLIHGA